MPITDASFVPANPSAWVQENRLLGSRFLDVTEEFHARAAECQHLANRSGGEGKRQYEELARQWRGLDAPVSSRLVGWVLGGQRRAAGLSFSSARGGRAAIVLSSFV